MGNKFLIDGRFLKEMSTGVDRFAGNVCGELDKICGGCDIAILVPPDANEVPQYKNIKIIQPRVSRMWTQGVFAIYAGVTGRIPVNLCNEATSLARKGVVVLHDVCYAEDKEHFPYVDEIPADERQWFLKVYKRIVKKARKLVTVSHFSAKRIEAKLGVPEKNIAVIGNGWQHIENAEVDVTYFERHPEVVRGEYYLTLTSANKNKNLDWVLKAAKNNPESTFVICGKNLDKKFDLKEYSNVVYAGFVRDPEAKALMGGCKAFLFPSYYEGFGIPPMEAMSQGACAIVSDRASLPEIFEKSVHYIDPENANVDLDGIMREPLSPASVVLNKYSWEKSARKLLEVLNKL